MTLNCTGECMAPSPGSILPSPVPSMETTERTPPRVLSTVPSDLSSRLAFTALSCPKPNFEGGTLILSSTVSNLYILLHLFLNWHKPIALYRKLVYICALAFKAECPGMSIRWRPNETGNAYKPGETKVVMAGLLINFLQLQLFVWRPCE